MPVFPSIEYFTHVHRFKEKKRDRCLFTVVETCFKSHGFSKYRCGMEKICMFTTGLFEDLNWMDIERYLEQNNRVIVTIGACEQHGYLSLLSDTLIPMKVAQKVCEDEKIIMTPPIPFGVSTAWKAYPGTISLKPTTFILLVQEIIEELWRQGFRRILLNNGHGGNMDFLTDIMIEFNNTHSNARVNYFSGFNYPTVYKIVKEVGLTPTHGSWFENFSFTRVCRVPQENDKKTDRWPAAPTSRDYRKTLGDGVSDGPYQVSDQVMTRIFDAMVEGMKLELKQLDKVYTEYCTDS